ncbi:GerMN domain-containing protein [Citricoccus sp. NPDC055426]|uniref:GerMN domain-containing protein n=1 Tax=Citricoccus sp. NPDC055426 TaxID=3155536 RepID=UPI00343BB3BA
MSHSRTALRPLLTTGALAAVLALGLTACGQGGGDATESPSTTPSATESASASPSASASESPTASASPSQSASTSPSASASPSASTSASEPAAAATEATVYWVGPAGQSGGIEFPGCGEVLIEDTVPVSEAGAVGDPALVEAGLQALFDERSFDVGSEGLMNALFQSELTVQDVTIEGDTVTVDLAGQPMSGGTCADPQIIAQLENTAIANAGTYTAEILVAGEPIQEFMSQKG